MILPCQNCSPGNTVCVPGRGPDHAELMLVGEAPGKDEVKRIPPKCWIGKAGQELKNYLAKISNIDVESVYLNNLCKFHPPNDRDPTREEIESCSRTLEMEIATINPKYIACLGAISTRYFLGSDVTLERCHGIPVEKEGRIILPMYHPAAGLHNSTMMVDIVSDFEVLGKLVRGKVRIGAINDEYANCEYRLAKSTMDLSDYLRSGNVVAIDTESVKDVRWRVDNPWWGGVKPWCMSLSTHAGTARVVMFSDEGLVEVVRERLCDSSVLALIHNIMYDKPILDAEGVVLGNVRDTMVMAYLTQSLPQGLKDLAYRLRGMKMNSYDEMVKQPAEDNALMYLDAISNIDWGKPEEQLVWTKGVPHIKKGWGLQRRVTRILNDYEKDESTDVRERWGKIEDHVRLVAEKQYGLMPIGDLSEIDVDEAVRYSGRDADATLRVYPPLLERVESLNIKGVE